jgi:Holliday junction resolvase RusA-like endonuclease
MMHFILPVPPSANMAYRNVPGIGRVKTKEHKDWKREAAIIVKLQHRQQGGPVMASGQPFKMLVKVNINRRGDIMNREKLLTDLLVGLEIIPDDRWCDEFTIYRSPHVSGVEVIIAPLMGLGSGSPAPPPKGSGKP